MCTSCSLSRHCLSFFLFPPSPRRRLHSHVVSIVNNVIHDSHMMIVTTTLTRRISISHRHIEEGLACSLRKSQTKKQICHSIEFCFQSSLLPSKRKLPKFASAHPRHIFTQSRSLEFDFAYDN